MRHSARSYRRDCFMVPWLTKSKRIMVSSLHTMPYYAVICRVLTSLYFCLSVILIFTVPAVLGKSWHMSVLKRSRNVVRIEGADYSEKGAGFRKKVQIGRISGKSMKRCTFRRFLEKKVHVPRRPRQLSTSDREKSRNVTTEMRKSFASVYAILFYRYYVDCHQGHCNKAPPVGSLSDRGLRGYS